MFLKFQASPEISGTRRRRAGFDTIQQMWSRRAFLLSAIPLLAADAKFVIRKLTTRKYTIHQRDYLFLEIETDNRPWRRLRFRTRRNCRAGDPMVRAVPH